MSNIATYLNDHLSGLVVASNFSNTWNTPPRISPRSSSISATTSKRTSRTWKPL